MTLVPGQRSAHHLKQSMAPVMCHIFKEPTVSFDLDKAKISSTQICFEGL